MQRLPASAEVKDVVRRHWAGRAPTFDEAPNHGLHTDAQRAAWQARVRGWTSESASASDGGQSSTDSDAPMLDALDVGCGTGFLALLLADLGHRVTGVDAADEMLDRARDKAARAGLSVAVRRADAERLPFEDASFDLVVERHVLWTLPDPDAALAEWTRVLRPGGRLVLVEGDWRSTPSADYEPIRDALPLFGGRPSEELAAFVAERGLVDVTAEPLMDPKLWGGEPERERYALHARKARRPAG